MYAWRRALGEGWDVFSSSLLQSTRTHQHVLVLQWRIQGVLQHRPCATASRGLVKKNMLGKTNRRIFYSEISRGAQGYDRPRVRRISVSGCCAHARRFSRWRPLMRILDRPLFFCTANAALLRALTPLPNENACAFLIRVKGLGLWASHVPQKYTITCSAKKKTSCRKVGKHVVGG